MNGLKDIIASGKAPGLRLGQPAYDPQSVYAKVPKALKELERGERRSKRGVDAKDIAKRFGMPLDFIKKTWSKPVPLALLILLWSIFTAGATDITAGTYFQDGQTVNAAILNQLVGSATINPTFYSAKPLNSSPASSDEIVVYVPSAQELEKESIGSALAPIYVTLPQSAPGPYDLFSFYSTETTNAASITLSNLGNNISEWIDVSNLDFALETTNSGGQLIPTNFVLSAYTPRQPYPFSTNHIHFMCWDTNGIPYQIGESNLLVSLGQTMWTNWALPYEFTYNFQPWLYYGTNIYGTNSGGVPLFTNAWGFYTNFPITSLLLTNAYNPTNTTQTLVDSDTIPVNSGQQQTNTTMTLGSLEQLITNDFPSVLPAYTTAREQFSGLPLNIALSNSPNFDSLIEYTTNNLTNVFAYGYVYGVTFSTNAHSAAFEVQTNQIYYIVPTNASDIAAAYAHVFTNYNQAVAGSNYITGLVNIGVLNWMLYQTNYTSYNCDPTAVTSASAPYTGAPTIRFGIYDTWFRQGSFTPLYYVTGNSEPAPALLPNPTVFNLSADDVLTTNHFRLQVLDYIGTASSASDCSPLIHCLVQPQ